MRASWLAARERGGGGVAYSNGGRQITKDSQQRRPGPKTEDPGNGGTGGLNAMTGRMGNDLGFP